MISKNDKGIVSETQTQKGEDGYRSRKLRSGKKKKSKGEKVENNGDLSKQT
jgi:hypothetical protein